VFLRSTDFGLSSIYYLQYSLEGVESRPDRIVGGEDRFLDCLLYNIYSLEGVESRPDRIVGDRFFGLSSI
jgi:hypothetical protein